MSQDIAVGNLRVLSHWQLILIGDGYLCVQGAIFTSSPGYPMLRACNPPVIWATPDATIGIVRVTGRELADRRSSRFSRGELMPLGQGGRTVLFEDVAAVEVTVVVEVVLD